MAHYTISLAKLGPLPNTPQSQDAALTVATNFLRLRGHTFLGLDFTDPDTVLIRDRDAGPLCSIALAAPRPAGRPPTKHLVTEKPVKPFYINGRPSATGWYRCRTLVELNLDAATAMLGQVQTPWATHLVYMDRDGNPLLAVPVPGVPEEAKRLAAGRMHGRGVVIDRASVACQMALGHVVEQPPRDAVAVFVLAWDAAHRWFTVFGKRLVVGLPHVPYTPAKAPRIELPLTSGSSMSADEARAAYERQQAGLPPLKKSTTRSTGGQEPNLAFMRERGHVAGTAHAKPPAKRAKK